MGGEEEGSHGGCRLGRRRCSTECGREAEGDVEAGSIRARPASVCGGGGVATKSESAIALTSL